MIVEDFDIVQRGLDHRAGPFIEDVNTGHVLEALLAEVQELESSGYAFLQSLYLDNASGDQLRLLGLRVDEEPLDDSDEDYKLRVRLKIRATRSSGRDQDFADLLALLPADLSWRMFESAGWVSIDLVSGTLAFSAAQLHRILSYATSAGRSFRLVYPAAGDASDTMTFPSFDATVSGSQWPSYDGAITGTAWATLLRDP